MQKLVEDYFKNNPEEEKVFSTADGFLFAQEMYATAHAATITEKEVKKHPREVVKFAVLEVEVPVSTVTEAGNEIRTKNEAVDAPDVTDSPLEVDGKVDAIVEAVKEKVADVKANVEPANKATPAKAKGSK